MRWDAIGEFVLTYTWGFLIVGMVLSTMGALGYFDASTLISQSCESQKPFTCLSMQLTNESTIDVAVRSTIDTNLTIFGAQVSDQTPPCGGVRNISVNNKPLPATLRARDVARLVLVCTTRWAAQDQYQGKLAIDYANESGKRSQAMLTLQGVITT